MHIMAKNQKIIIFFFIVFLTACSYNNQEVTFRGNFNYSKKEEESANNNLGIDFKKPIYTSKNKKYMYYLGGSVNHNYDVFNDVTFINGFGQLGVEF